MKECPLCGRCLTDVVAFCPEDGAPGTEVFPGPAVLDGKYLLLGRLGRGGMSVVYRARHLGLDRMVAVKLLRAAVDPDPASLERFRREAQALGRLRHPHVVAVTDSGFELERGIPYLVLELLEGPTMAQELRSQGPMALTSALPSLREVAEAVDASHAEGIVHGDLKPGNVILVETASGREARVLDFGLATFLADFDATPVLGRHADGARSAVDVEEVPAGPGQLLGTPGYLAPERLNGDPASAASDVYAFGALACALLTGQPPRPTGGGGPGSPVGLEPALAEALAPALELRAADRPLRAGVVVAALECALAAAERRRFRVREAPRRLALALGLGILAMALATPFSRVLEGFDRRVTDLLLSAEPTQPPDSRIQLVLLDEATLAADPKPLAARAEETARGIQALLDAGAAAVAVDLLLPPSWGQDPSFSGLVLERGDRLVLAAFSPAKGPVVGPEVVTGLTAAALGPERLANLFGFVNVEEDSDGRVRRFTPCRPDLAGRLAPSFAALAASRLRVAPPGSGCPWAATPRWIDASIDDRLLATLSWEDLPRSLAQDPRRFEGRLVIVGAEYAASGDDGYRLAGGGDRRTSGVRLQALFVQTLLSPMTTTAPTGPFPWMLGALAAAIAAAGVLLWPDQLLAPFLALAAGVLAWAVAVALAHAGGWLLAVGVPLVAVVLGALLAVAAGRLLGRQARLAALLLLLSLAPTTSAGAEERRAEPAVAIAVRVLAPATARAPGAAEIPLTPFARLVSGTVIQTGPAGEVTVVFFDGRRFRIGPETKAEVVGGVLEARVGEAVALQPVPAMAGLAPLLSGRVGIERPAAVRIRGEGGVGVLEPGGGESVAAAEDTLRFPARPGATEYRVTLEEAGGRRLLAEATVEPYLRLPEGTLQPGRAYYWVVEATGPGLHETVGSAVFRTLPAELAVALAGLEEQAVRTADSSLFLLLAEADFLAGRPRESCLAMAHARAAATKAGLEPPELAGLRCPSG